MLVARHIEQAEKFRLRTKEIMKRIAQGLFVHTGGSDEARLGELDLKEEIRQQRGSGGVLPGDPDTESTFDDTLTIGQRQVGGIGVRQRGNGEIDIEQKDCDA